MIYIISKEGKPLMPTKRHGKVKHLLREGKAKVIRRCPFTIQLLYDSKAYTQEITLGIDAGSSVVGISATTEKEELYVAEATLRWDIIKLLAERRGFRRSRRNRKTRYRAPRFNNRTASNGYITKNTRIKNNLEKSHCVDARCISGNPTAKPLGYYYEQRFLRKNNRSLHKANPKKGKRKSNQAPRYVCGYQLFDKVVYKHKECFIFGRRSSGYFDLRLLDGTSIHKSANVKEISKIESRNTLIIERRMQGSA